MRLRLVASRRTINTIADVASYEIRNNRWRAHVRRYGHQRSATFNSIEEAQRWALAEEQEIFKALGVQAKLHRPALLPTHEELARLDDARGLLLDRAGVASLPRLAPGCGVYFLFSGDEIVYVGQSVNVFARVAGHFVYKSFDSFAFVPCRHDQRLALESHYIKLFSPALNVSKKAA